MAVIKNTTDYIDQQYHYQLKEMILQMKLQAQAKKEQDKYKVKLNTINEVYEYYKPLFNSSPPAKKTSKQATVDFPELNDAES